MTKIIKIIKIIFLSTVLIVLLGVVCFADELDVPDDGNDEIHGSYKETASEQEYINDDNAKELNVVNQNQMNVGWVHKNGNTYYYIDPYHYYRDCICKIDNKVYGFDENGYLRIGKYQYKDNYYFGDLSDGSIFSNQWVVDGANKYFANASGSLYKNIIISFGDTTYGMGGDAALIYGHFERDGEHYISKDSGEIIKNQWIILNENRYFASADGKLYRNRTISFGNIKYALGNTGEVIKGIVNVAGELYYADPDKNGEISSSVGWIDIDGKSYFAKYGGALYRDRTISFGATMYAMGTEGYKLMGIVKVNGINYYANPVENGVIRLSPGWFYVNGKAYFSSPTGALYTSRILTFGNIAYAVGKDSAKIEGGIFTLNGEYYYADSTNNGQVRLEVGWLNLDDKTYFVGPGGKFYHNQFITFGNTAYYLNSDGSIVKNQFTKDGVVITPNSRTGEINYNEYLQADVIARAREVAASLNYDLYNAFYYCANMSRYYLTSNGRTSGPIMSSADYAKYGYKNRGGDCIVMASSFKYLAQACGYSATQWFGWVGSSTHSWCEIGGYIYDPNFTNATNRSGYGLTYGQKGTWKYRKSYTM